MEGLSWHERVDALITALGNADWRGRDSLKADLLSLVEPLPRKAVEEYLTERKRDQPLEVRWEIEEVLDDIAPSPVADTPVEEPEEPLDPNRPMEMSNLTLVFDDPRGLMLYRAKVGSDWYASQVNPNTGQSQLFKISDEEVANLKTQLVGSPYWLLGSGGLA